ncbi:MAG: glycosyltransferase family 4 protein [bacterium]|nr:glycosyltransferase family 4 protein [bacterium]
MLGWEFPPFISGGLGTACYGLTRALNQAGVEVSFVLPRPIDAAYAGAISPGLTRKEQSGPITLYHRAEFPGVRFWALGVALAPYLRPEIRGALGVGLGAEPKETEGAAEQDAPYTGDLFAEVERYARLTLEMAACEKFDLIHAHDWMTYPAGVALAMTTGTPLVVHVHSTEYDRCAESLHPRISQIERRGLHAADAVIAVSRLTRNLIVKHYEVDPGRIHVVYNATTSAGPTPNLDIPSISPHEKIVLFLGRVTAQKGPEYFIRAACRVLESDPEVRFVVAGSGDLIRQTMEQADALGIRDKVVFTGFLHGDDVERVFRMADLYVMPSVSEPFGIAALEALSYGVPALISRQSGAAEVLKHAMKVDFWNVERMAEKILTAIRNAPVQAALRAHGRMDLRGLSWEKAAGECQEVYGAVLGDRAEQPAGAD